MLRRGVIQPSSSPWASPISMLKKKDGTFRFCVDYRRVNAVTRPGIFPLPRVDDLLDQLGGGKLFSCLDAANRYWQAPLSPASREKTAFVTNGGLYEFTVMPFGLTSAPSTFQRLTQRVLSGLSEFCGVYMDNIVVFLSSIQEHLEHLRVVFERLSEANIKLKPSKCQFSKDRFTYLGHIIYRKGIQTDPEKSEAVRSLKEPINVGELRRFL